MTKIKNSPPCVVCSKPSVAKKLCDMHYRRLSKHGHVAANLRPTDWGQRHKHPLYHSWKGMNRTHIGVCPEWADFWQFVSDVGDRPSPRHSLKRRDRSQPYGPQNCYWQEPVYDAVRTDASRKVRADRYRAYHAANPHRMKNIYLKKQFGITIQDYDRMMEEQGGVCFICKQTDPNFALAVDHCHTTKIVRGLLCTNCNRGLGHFNDDPARLEAAIVYLQRPRLNRAA